MNSKAMAMASLGRPLYPGMLYDCRSDSFIPGVTLWDEKALREDLDVRQQPKTNLKFTASDTFSEKANLLDISASLKASFLSGLVEVGGSAKFLKDTKSSASQCRVTMQYSQTSKFEQLTMKELGSITYPQVFEQKTATHVVIAVLYGAQAFMLFDYSKDENENKQEIEGNLHAVVKKIPTISIEGQASLKMNENEKKLAENISVTFYGDLVVEQNPTTYQEALEVYKKLPSLMKQQQNEGVPLTVWLHPLSLLDNKAAKLVREINMSLISKAEELLEELAEVERRCKDLLKNQTTDKFPDVKDRLLKFQALQRNSKRSFQKELSKVLPAIRNGTQEDKALEGMLNSIYTLPFAANKMKDWLDEMMNEIKILSSYTSGLEDLTVVKSSGSLKSILFDPNVDVVVCLSFTSLKYEDAYLAAMQDILNNEELTKLEQTSKKVFPVPATPTWLSSPDVLERMRQNLSRFTSFSKANKNEKRIKFIIGSISDPNNPGSSIQLYKKSILTNPNFLPVSKPPKPVVEPSERKVTLKLSKAPTGETVRFRVEYRMTPPTDSGADADTWTITDTSDAQNTFTLTQLKPEEKYWVRYRAVSDVGASEASDSVPFTFFGKLNVTVAKWDFSMPFLFNELRTKLMTGMGMSRWSLDTVMSEVTKPAINPTSRCYEIPGGLRAGMAIYLQGVVSAPAESFLPFGWLSPEELISPKDTGSVYRRSGPVLRFSLGDGHLHVDISRMDTGRENHHLTGTPGGSGASQSHGDMRPGTNNWIICDSLRTGNWERQEKTPVGQISNWSAFDIFIVNRAEGYEVYINGQRTLLFKHRMPMEKVTTLYFHKDVMMNVIGIVEDWNTSTFGKELSSGTSRTMYSNIQSHVPKPVCNPSKGYTGSIPEGLRAGVALFFQGVVPSDFERFEINLQTGPKYLYDIAFHFNPRVNCVVLNNCRNGTWENQINAPGGPFVKGGAFDIIMLIKAECYDVIVNGLSYCTFDHRIPVSTVNTLDIRGDVFMNTFGVMEVDSVNLKVTIPGNV